MPKFLSAAALFIATASNGGAAQTADSVLAPRQSTVGLALSGGSAKGFAHIGVLRVLEEAGIKVEAVAGTSMGSIVGGLYAIGYTPAMLRDVAQREDWNAVFTDALDRSNVAITRKLERDRHLVTLSIRDWRPQLPAGLVRGQRLSELLTRLTWSAHTASDFRELPIPFAAVATDIATPSRGSPLSTRATTSCSHLAASSPRESPSGPSARSGAG